MKKILALIFLSVCYGAVSSQNTFPTNGNVGIGSLSPAAKISFNNVNDGADTPGGITWYNEAPLNYGIFRTPGTWVSPAFQQLKLSWDTGIILDPGNAYQNSYVDIQRGGLRVSSGNVLIGKITQTNTAYVLDVNGKARANEVVVNTTGADFVFEPDYKLTNLTALEKFIKTNRHLPEVPTAKQMVENGVGLGELNIKLLQKVEELTLHLIEKDKQLKHEKNINKTQQAKIDGLERGYVELTKQVHYLIKSKK